MSGKQLIDIERAVQWAIRDELPKGHAIGKGAWDIVSNFAELGTRIDVSRNGGGLGFLAGEPHEDADKIAAAIRGLPGDASLDLAEVEAIAAPFGALDPLAISALAGARYDMRALVVRCGALGEPMPHVMRHWPSAVPSPRQMFIEHAAAGRPRALVFGRDPETGELIALAKLRGKRAAGGELYPLAFEPYSPLAFEPSLAQVIEVRAEFTIWRRALVLLRERLANQLREHLITGPARPAMPWNEPEIAARVLDAGERIVADPLPLGRVGPITPRPHESDIERKAREWEGKSTMRKKPKNLDHIGAF